MVWWTVWCVGGRKVQGGRDYRCQGGQEIHGMADAGNAEARGLVRVAGWMQRARDRQNDAERCSLYPRSIRSQGA